MNINNNDKLLSSILLSRKYKDHTVQNPVNELGYDKLPPIAFSVHNQNIRNLSVTIQIIDEKTDEIIETLNGLAESGSVKADSSSLVRRTMDLKLKVTDSTFPQDGSLLWFNNKARVYVGIDDNSTPDTKVNFLVGTFWVDEGSYSINEDGEQVSFTFSDKMTKWNEEELEYPLRIDVGTPVHIAIKTLMEHIGETDFGEIVESREGEVVPYTIEYGAGDKVVNLIEELRDMYMDYFCGYNVMGQFEFQRVDLQKRSTTPQPKWRFDTNDNVLNTMLEFNESYSLKDIRNRVVVYGGTNEVSGLTPVGEARLTNVDSPFNIYAIGKRKKILVEKKYATNEQCIAHAKYELYKSSSFNEKASITTIPLYLIDVNDIIEVVHPKTKEKSLYVVDSFSYGLDVDDTMTISAYKLYFVTVEYGKEDIPLVDYMEKAILNHGWIKLAEDAIALTYNMMANGEGILNVSFENNIPGFEQARVQAYPTTENQSMVFDLADLKDLDLNSTIGSYIVGSNRSSGDNVSRLVMHEMVHAVTNNVLGFNKAIQLPIWFQEGTAELIHGARERFESVYPSKSNVDKRNEIIKLSSWLLDNNFTGSSEEYVASYMLLWSLYRLLEPNGNFDNMFARLKRESNLSLNFLAKLIPNATSTQDAKDKLLYTLNNNMDDIWSALFDTSNQDTGSLLGSIGKNYYGIPLTKNNVMNPNNYDGSVSSGFKIKIIR